MPRLFEDPDYEEQVLNEVEQRAQRFGRAQKRAQDNTGYARRVEQHAARYPYAQQGVVEGMASAGLEPDSTMAEVIAASSGEFRGKRGELASTDEASSGWFSDLTSVLSSAAETGRNLAGDVAGAAFDSPPGEAIRKGVDLGTDVAGAAARGIATPFNLPPVKGAVRGLTTGAYSAAHEAVARPATAAMESFAPGQFFPGFSPYTQPRQASTASPDEQLQRVKNIYDEQGGSPAARAFQKIRRGDTVDLGSGFFPGGDIMEQHRSDVTEREVITHEGRTGVTAENFYGGDVSPGRTYTSAMVPDEVLEPGSTGYNLASGLVDFAAAIKLDPTAAVGRAAGQAGQAQRTFGRVGPLDRARDVLGGAMIDGPRRTTVSGQVENFLTQEDAGRRIVSKLTETTRPNEVWRGLGRKTDANTSARLAETTTDEQTLDVLRNVLGTTIREKPGGNPLGRGIARMGGSEWGSVYGFGAGVRHRFADGVRYGKTMRKGKHNRMFWGEFPNHRPVDLDDPSAAMRQVEDYMKNAMVSEDRIANRLDEIARIDIEAETSGERVDRMWGQLRGMAEDIDVELASRHKEPHLSKKLTRLMEEYNTEVRAYFIDEVGDPGYFQGSKVRHLPDGTARPEPTAHLGSEYMNTKIDLPDPRRLRQETSRVYDTLDKVKLRNASEVTTAMMDNAMKWWKAGTLLRSAWFTRVAMDEQARMAAAGMDSAFNHPASWLIWASGRRGRIDPSGGLTRQSKEFVDSMSNARHWMETGGKKPTMGAVHTGDYVRTRPGEANYVRGLTDEIAQLARDEIGQRVAGGLKQGEASPNGLPGMRGVKDWLANAEEGQRLIRQLDEGRPGSFPREGLLGSDPENVSRYVDSVWARINLKTGGRAEFRDGTGRPVNMMNATDNQLASGTWHTTLDGDQELIEGIGQGRVLDVELLDELPQTTKLKEMQRAVQSKVDEGVQPDTVKVSREVNLPGGQGTGVLDQFLDKAFYQMMGRQTDWTARAPVYRQHLWDEAERLLPQTTKDGQLEVLHRAREAGLDRDTLRRMAKVYNDPQQGSGALASADDLNEVARAYANVETKRMLYDMSKRGQFADITRNIFPFAEAFKEILTTWPRLARDNPAVARRAQQVAESGFFTTGPYGEEQFAYPGGDMPGLFGAVTGGGGGAMVGGLAGARGTAVGAAAGAGLGALVGSQADEGPGQLDMTGRAESLNLAMQSGFVPGFGPIVQFPASYLISEKPEMEGVKELIMPFGRPGGERMADPFTKLGDVAMPAWAEKAVTAATADPQSDRIFSNAVGRAAKRLYASGEYSDFEDDKGMLTPEGRRRLRDDASRRARWLYALRSVAQFSVPTGPQPQYSADTLEGLVSFGELSKELRRMKDEDYDDWEKAEQAFIERFGLENALHLQSSTRSLSFRALDESGAAWELENQDLRDKYPQVASFFAPVDPDADLDYDQYLRAIEAGDIESLTPDEQFKLHNHTVGKMAMAAERNKLGERGEGPGGRAYLEDYKKWLKEEYPGYDSTEATMPRGASTEDLINQMNRAVEDPKLADTELAQGWREYMAARQQARTHVAQIRGGGRSPKTFTAKSTAHLSAYLNDMGEYLAGEYDGFNTAFDRILSRELLTREEIQEKISGP